jgi:hypothetical protein
LKFILRYATLPKLKARNKQIKNNDIVTGPPLQKIKKLAKVKLEHIYILFAVLDDLK